MRLVAFLLRPGEDLRESIEAEVARRGLSAATVVSGVGALRQVHLRMAGAQPGHEQVRTIKGEFEIVSLIGNLGPGRTHLHIAVADETGKVIGGHVKSGAGCIVGVTAEIVLAAEDGLRFVEKFDPETGWDNLVVERLAEGY